MYIFVCSEINEWSSSASSKVNPKTLCIAYIYIYRYRLIKREPIEL